MPRIIAHRGASRDEPENSLAAFRRALGQSADGVEFDVHTTADGALVVVHDPELGGTPISALGAAAVRAHRLANGEPIPTLDEALACITPGGTACIETKTLPAAADEALLAAIGAAPAPERCQVHAFDHRIIRRLSASGTALTLGVLSGSYPLDPTVQVRAAGARVLWQHVDLVDAPLVAQIHEAGYEIVVWTADRPDDVRRLADLGVDGICTNRPDVAREALS